MIAIIRVHDCYPGRGVMTSTIREVWFRRAGVPRGAILCSMSEIRSEIQFLRGPQSRWQELTFTVKTPIEFIRGFRALHFIGPCVTFFGSAGFYEHHEYYQMTRKVAGEVGTYHRSGTRLGSQ